MDYRKLYQEKRKHAAEIAEQIGAGQHVYTDITLAQPKEILRALGERAGAGALDNTVMHNILDVYPMPGYDPQTAQSVRGVSWFLGGGARKSFGEGIGDVMPGYYRDFPRLMRETQQIDAVVLAVSPMDDHGYFSTATVGSASEAMLEKADRIFLEVNDRLPRALRSPMIHISRVTSLCEASYALPELPRVEIDETSRKIGELIAAEVPDGATLQLGIGAIPDAVGEALAGKKHLGLHTEMLTDSMIGLIECGAVDNSRKPLNRGITVATFAFGSRRIYDYIDNNPAVALLPVDYVNSPAVIAQHPDFISVNAALEVDFFGQVCAESIGTRVISGTGGQSDYVRGAVLSPGGKSFIAFPSTAAHGKVSRIVPTLAAGAQVSTSKNDVDNIVTEYGIARLHGKSLSERTRALIAVAHPSFREELIFRAKQEHIL